MADLLINGLPARSTYGFVLAEAPGWMDAPARQTATVQIPGRVGVTAIGAMQEQARKITLRGVVRGASVADCRAKLDALKAALCAPSLTLTFPDSPAQFVYASLESFPVSVGGGASMVASTIGVEIGCTLSDPLRYDLAPTTLAVNVGDTKPIPLGTGPSRPLLTLPGPSTSPAIRVYDRLGTLIGQLIFNGLTLVGGQTLVIDCDAMTIAINGVNALSALTAGDFVVFEPSVLGSINDPSWGTITISSGALTVSYRKAWR